MHWIALVAACLALILARLLRAPDRSSLLVGAGSFLAAFLVAVFLIRGVSDRAMLTRPTEYDAFIVHAAEQAAAEPDAPLAAFVGASFSRNGLDDEALTRRLRAKGYPHRVINLSLQGASLQEREEHLQAFIRLSGRVPDSVFLEVAEEFDHDPAYVFSVAKFSDRAIEQLTPEAAYWSAKGLSQGQCDGKVACAKSWVLLGIHSVMNNTNLGLLATGETLKDIPPVPSFDPQDTPRETFTMPMEEVRLGLSTSSEASAADGPAWARLFRLDQRQRLQSAGVRRIAYYYPPVISPRDRDYVASLCQGELSDYPCIAPVDPALLSKLEGPVWFDEKHLLKDGAETYTAWLANQIDRSGALK